MMLKRKSPIPYQSNERSFTIRKIRSNFDAISINERPHRHEFTEMLYIKSGSGKHEIDGQEYDLEPNAFYIISKGQVHNFLVARGIEGFLIRFEDSILPAVHSSKDGFYYNLLFALRHENELILEEDDSSLVDILLSRMLEEYKVLSGKMVDLSFIQHLFYPVIILLNRYAEVDMENMDYHQDQFANFINLLEQSFKQHHDLSFYADELGLSSRKLTAICHKESGKSAKKIINDRVLTGAMRLVRYTSLPLKEITGLLGYKDMGYFCRTFKKATGKTPSEYKNT